MEFVFVDNVFGKMHIQRDLKNINEEIDIQNNLLKFFYFNYI